MKAVFFATFQLALAFAAVYETRRVPIRWGVTEDEFKPNSIHVYRVTE